jgi:hypothetical protein
LEYRKYLPDNLSVFGLNIDESIDIYHCGHPRADENSELQKMYDL